MALGFQNHVMPPVPEGKVRVFRRDYPGKGWLWARDETLEDFHERLATGFKAEYRLEGRDGQPILI